MNYQKLYDANFSTPSGARLFDLIYSADFTGTVDGIPKDGSVVASQTYGDGIERMLPKTVVVTTGEVELSVNS